MSTDISFLLEYDTGTAWVPALHVADLLSDPRTHLGIVNVCWWSVRNDRTTLFFGEDALIPFHPGFPDDLAVTTRNHVEPNFENNMRYAGWISLEDLVLPTWASTQVTVGGKVEARFAELFGDGMQPPPIEALRKQGVAEPVMETITNWKSMRQRQAETVPPHRLRRLSPDVLVSVTWRESLVEFVGYIWNEGLSNLSEIEHPELYRIVTAIG